MIPALSFRESRSPHDDAPPDAFLGPVWEPWHPPELLPDPPTTLANHVAIMTIAPRPRSPFPDAQFPQSMAEARSAIAAKHGIQCLDMTYRMPVDALDLVHVLQELRAAGYEAWAKSAPNDPELLRVFTRDNPVSFIDADVLTRVRESAGLTYDEVLGDLPDAA